MMSIRRPLSNDHHHQQNMRTSSSSASNLHSLKEKITCRVCNKQYNTPKTLPCLHSYCLSCLASLQLSELAMKKLVCPECDKTVVIDGDSLNGLPDAFCINRQIREFTFLQKVHGIVDTKCEKCTGKSVKATSFCDGCGKFVCDLCVTIHKSWSEFSSHKLLSLSDLKECYHKYIPNDATPTRCVQHEKECTVYCETCQREICHECIIRSHREHQYNLTTDSARQHKASTREQLLMVDTVPSELDAAISKLERLVKNFTEEGKAVKSKLETRFKDLEMALAKRHKALGQDASSMVDGKIRLLEDQRKELIHIKKKVTSCKDFVNQMLDTEHDSEFFVLKKQMCDRIAEVSKEFSATELTPIEEPSIQLLFDNNRMKKELKHAGCVSDGSQLYVGYSSLANGVPSSTVTSHFLASEVVSFFISLSTSFFKMRSSPADQITAEIQCLRDNTLCPATVKINSNGFAKVQFSFNERGRYVFMVKVAGQHISGSPHPFFVLPSTSTQFHSPVRSISKLTTPKGLAVNRKNQIIVSQEDLHNVTLFGKRCRKVLSFGSYGSGEAQFSSPNGVSVDNHNCIYVSDSKNNRVQKFDSEGNFIKEYFGEKNTKGVLSQPTGIQITSEGEVYVVDRGNARIVVLSTDLAYKRTFGSAGKEKGQFEDPWGVTTDANGLVYVTDMKLHTIQIFDPMGEYRGQIGTQGTQKSRLNRPSGIAIDQFGKIFVCEFGNHRVSIFHVSSEFIDCFSIGLSMVNPHSIALDEDGFIYVSSAEAVHVF